MQCRSYSSPRSGEVAGEAGRRGRFCRPGSAKPTGSASPS